MEKHSFDQTPFLTVAFTVDCQNTTKSIWKEFLTHTTRERWEPIFDPLFFWLKATFAPQLWKVRTTLQNLSVSKLSFYPINECIKFYVYQFRNLKKAWLQWLSIFQIFRQKFLFDPLAFFMEMFFTHQFMHTTLFWPTSFYWGLLLIHYRESSKEMARKCIKKGSHW